MPKKLRSVSWTNNRHPIPGGSCTGSHDDWWYVSLHWPVGYGAPHP